MINENLVIDVGMHKGEDAIHYLKSGYQVIGIEANPILVKEAKVKFQSYINSGKLSIINVGIAKEKMVLPFYQNLRLSEWSSFDYELGTRSNTQCQTINVPCISTEELLQEYGTPFYLKIDIEGYDLIAVSGLPNQKDKLPKYLSCEAGNVECLDVLKSKGYTKFKLINQLNNFKAINLKTEANPFYPRYQIIRNGIKLRLQKFINYKHPYGSAGPFAEKTAGKWLSYKQARDLYLGFVQHEKQQPLNHVSWFDFHATF